MVLYMSIVLYAPALALSAVTGVSHWVAIISVGSVCTFYCTIGGMKAVLWTDLFQSGLMFISLFAVIIQGSLDVGGLGNVFKIAYDGGRLNFASFSFDPSERHTFWSLAIGGIFVYTSIYAVNQAQVQRLLTVKSLKRAQLALFLNWPITTLLSLTTSLTGLVIYANLSHCDPLLRPFETNVKTADQLLPYYVMQSLSKYSGVPGLFVAGIFSGALSTVSSSVNSLAAVTLEDFIKPFASGPNNQMTDSRSTFISKILAFSYGILCVLLTYVAEQLGGVLQASLTVFSVVGGPLLGLFTLGMLFPKANQKGAIIGFLSALLLCLWIGFGTMATGIKTPTLPLSDKGCPAKNGTFIEININNFTEIPLEDMLSDEDYMEALPLNSTFIPPKEVFVLYRLSYLWYAGLGWIVTLLVGIIVSFVTGFKTDVEPDLISPVYNSCKLCNREKLRMPQKSNEFEDETKM